MKIIQSAAYYLKNLLREIDEVKKQEPKEKEIKEKKIAQKKIFIKNREESILLSKDHPFGKIIGSTQTVEYKTPGKKQYASRRKRKK